MNGGQVQRRGCRPSSAHLPLPAPVRVGPWDFRLSLLGVAVRYCAINLWEANLVGCSRSGVSSHCFSLVGQAPQKDLAMWRPGARLCRHIAPPTCGPAAQRSHVRMAPWQQLQLRRIKSNESLKRGPPPTSSFDATLPYRAGLTTLGVTQCLKVSGGSFQRPDGEQIILFPACFELILEWEGANPFRFRQSGRRRFAELLEQGSVRCFRMKVPGRSRLAPSGRRSAGDGLSGITDRSL